MLHKQVSKPKSEANRAAIIWLNILSHQGGMISDQRGKNRPGSRKQNKTLLSIHSLGTVSRVTDAVYTALHP